MSIKAITQAQINSFRKLGRQDKPDAMVILKLFLPSHGYYWYFTELETNPEADDYGIGFGFANLNDPYCAELGSIDIFELLNLRRTPELSRDTCKDLTAVKMGDMLSIGCVERDVHWEPVPISKIIEQTKKAC